MSRKAASTKPNALNDIAGTEVTGMLARNVPTRLIDISRTGCLFESRQRVEDGTVGELQLRVKSETFVDDVRVTRCVLVEGSGSVYRVGAEFVQTRRPDEHSIRRAVTAIIRELATRGTHVNSVYSTTGEGLS
jgi:PilZ domain